MCLVTLMLAACQRNPEKQTSQYLLGKKTLVPALWLLPPPTSPQELIPEEGRGLDCLEPKQPSCLPLNWSVLPITLQESGILSNCPGEGRHEMQTELEVIL